jgi:hydroxypyruvate reductase
MPQETRAILDQLFNAAVAAAHPATCLPPHLPSPPEGGRLIMIGAGKAGAAMAVATEEHYRGFDRLEGLVATRHGYGLPTGTIALVEAGHPVPDAMSIAAADRALQLAATAGPADAVLVLLSGGASAIMAAPVKGVTLADKQAATKALLRSGERIHEMNTVRKHLSRIKGGRLARAAAKARSILTLAISDVPGDDPAVIGSGPTVADPTTLGEARTILARLKSGVPDCVVAALGDARNESVKAGDPCLARAEYRLIAAPRLSLEAAARKAQALGYRPILLGDALEGEARDLGRSHAQLALEARQKGERVALLSGGEVTVTVTGNGRGGPNQEYALGLAIALQGASGIAALAADTDGADGGSGAADDPAGAVVLPDTLRRAEALLLNPVTFLQNNDSTGFFSALGDLVACGPTQTNVNDFRAVLIDP